MRELEHLIGRSALKALAANRERRRILTLTAADFALSAAPAEDTSQTPGETTESAASPGALRRYCGDDRDFCRMGDSISSGEQSIARPNEMVSSVCRTVEPAILQPAFFGFNAGPRDRAIFAVADLYAIASVQPIR